MIAEDLRMVGASINGELLSMRQLKDDLWVASVYAGPYDSATMKELACAAKRAFLSVLIATYQHKMGFEADGLDEKTSDMVCDILSNFNFETTLVIC